MSENLFTWFLLIFAADLAAGLVLKRYVWWAEWVRATGRLCRKMTRLLVKIKDRRYWICWHRFSKYSRKNKL